MLAREFPQLLASYANLPPHYIADLDVIPMAAFIKDGDGVYRDCNKTFERVMNMPRAYIIGKHTAELHPPGQTQICLDEDREIISTRRLGRFRTAFKMSDGAIIEAEVLKTPLPDARGEIVGILGVISEEFCVNPPGRTRADEAIRKLSQAVDQSPGMVMIVDTDGKITYINAKFTEVTGYTFAEIAGLSLDDCLKTGVHPASFYEEVWTTINAGREWRGEFCNKKKNGEHFWTLCSISPVKNAVGDIVYYLAIHQDITEHKALEEALRVSRDTLSLAAELANLGPWHFRPDKQCFEFNDEFYAIYATDIAREGRYMTPEQYAREFVHPDDAWMVDKEFQAVLAHPGPHYSTRIEHRIVRRDGEIRTVAVSINVVRDADGQPLLWYGANQDITEQKKAEQALAEKNVELQEALEKLQQTQTQLVQQEKMAGLGQLAAGVAHEINNPLGFVVSNFHTLQNYLNRITTMIDAYRQLCRQARAAESGPLQQLAETIEALEKRHKLDYIMGDLASLFAETGDGVDRVANIVKALLLFSRVDHQECFENYDLNAGIKNTLIVARNEIKYVAAVEEHLGDIPEIEAVGGKVNQVLLNILMNAAQAIRAKNTGEDGLISIRTYRDASSVYCAIADNGPGIPAEIRSHIFNPFFTTKPVGQGTGLGLSISYDIVVNRHHGDISVASEVASGTTFTVRLPITQYA